MKIALAHDWLNQMGGAENVLEQMVDIFPGAPVFTTIYAPKLMPDEYQKLRTKCSRGRTSQNRAGCSNLQLLGPGRKSAL